MSDDLDLSSDLNSATLDDYSQDDIISFKLFLSFRKMNAMPNIVKAKIAKDIVDMDEDDFSYIHMFKELRNNSWKEALLYIIIFPFIVIWVEHSKSTLEKFKKQNSEFFI